MSFAYTLSSFNTAAVFTVLAVISVAVGAALAYAFRRLPALAHVSADSESTLSVVVLALATAYGVILAFIIMLAWQWYYQAEVLVNDEVSKLTSIVNGASAFSAADVAAVRAAVIKYADSVVADEWPSLNTSGTTSPTTDAAFKDIWVSIHALVPDTSAKVNSHLIMVGEISEAQNDRTRRLFHAKSNLNPIFWWVLVSGLIIVVLAMSAITTAHVFAHTVGIAVVIWFFLASFYLIISLQLPFTGQASISSAPFTELTAYLST